MKQPSKILLYPFMGLALIGLSISLLVHVSTFVSQHPLFGEDSMILHFGIFITFIPASLIVASRAKDIDMNNFWSIILSGCPRWMKGINWFFFVYALVNFGLFAFSSYNLKGKEPFGMVARGFSGHWMLFYSLSFCILYSGAHSQKKQAAI